MEDRINEFFEIDFDPGQSRSDQAATEERIGAALEHRVPARADQSKDKKWRNTPLAGEENPSGN
jgi:hypothetical protein